MAKPDIDQVTLKSLLDYDPLTGVFIRKKTSWNLKSGDIAKSNYSNGYVRIYIDGVRYLAHRLAFIYMTGEAPVEVDHINRIRSDNRWINLRSVTRIQNIKNSKVHRTNILGVRGVSKTKFGTYKAKVTPITGPTINKTFSTLEEADKFVKEQLYIIHGEFASNG